MVLAWVFFWKFSIYLSGLPLLPWPPTPTAFFLSPPLSVENFQQQVQVIHLLPWQVAAEQLLRGPLRQATLTVTVPYQPHPRLAGQQARLEVSPEVLLLPGGSVHSPGEAHLGRLAGPVRLPELANCHPSGANGCRKWVLLCWPTPRNEYGFLRVRRNMGCSSGLFSNRFTWPTSGRQLPEYPLLARESQESREEGGWAETEAWCPRAVKASGRAGGGRPPRVKRRVSDLPGSCCFSVRALL